MRQRKWYLACPLVLLSSSFHASALILLLYYALSYVNWRKEGVRVAAILISLTVFVFLDGILENVLIGPFERYRDYLDSSFMQGNTFVTVSIRCFA